MIANWSRNVLFCPRHCHRPKNISDLRKILAENGQARVVGAGHSFNHIADTPEHQVVLSDMPRSIEIDDVGQLGRVTGQWTYGELCPKLEHLGWALANLASVPHVSVAGACATGTHGSGTSNGCLSTQIEEIELLTAEGDLITIAKADEWFSAAGVGLGALGVVTALTLKLQRSFSVVQYVYERIPLEEVATDLLGTMSHAYSVSLFTPFEEPLFADIWVKQVVADDAGGSIEPDLLFGVEPTYRDRHPSLLGPADVCTDQRSVGPWHLRLPHFRPDRIPASGDELQSEYFIPWHHAEKAIAAISELSFQLRDVLCMAEIRAIAADRFWLSPFNGRNSIAIHFSWRNDWTSVRAVLPLVEDALMQSDVRPHWGKLFTFSYEFFEAVYGLSFQRFLRVATVMDPLSKFSNSFLENNIFGFEASRT